jgi:flagellar basal-body rod modification protein FlgD
MVAVPTVSPTSPATTDPGSNALNSLSANFGDFLNLLLTQLQNQDPTSPMDANQFTSELVEFSSVEQQINANQSLSQLIQLTQSGDVMQASGIVGKSVTVQASQVPLQGGTGTLTFTAPAAEPVNISVTGSNGVLLRQDKINAVQGSNTWSWDGTNSVGKTLPDGAYTVTVTGASAGNASGALPFTVAGTATGVAMQNNTVDLQIGALSVPISSVVSVGTNN